MYTQRRILHTIVLVLFLLNLVVGARAAPALPRPGEGVAFPITLRERPETFVPLQAANAADSSVGVSTTYHMIFGLGRITSVAFSPNGQEALLGSEAGFALLVDLNTATFEQYFFGHTDRVTSVAFSPDGSQVLTGSDDATAMLWNATTGALIRTFTGHSDAVTSVAFSPDGTQVLTGSSDATAKLWDAATGALIRTFEDHWMGITSVAFSPDGSQVLTGSEDASAKLWNAATGALIRTFTGHGGGVTSVAFSPDGAKVLTGSEDATAKLWNATTGAELCSFEEHLDAVTSVAFSPDTSNAVVLTGSEDGTAKLWDATCGTVNSLRTFSGHQRGITAVTFSPDGSQVLTGSDDASACIWNAANGQLVITLAGHMGVVSSVAFSPDGSMVLTGDWDGTARLWDANTGRILRTFVVNTWGVNAVAFSYDGTRMLTGGSDNAAQLWDVNSGAILQTFTGHSGEVTSVAFSPDGQRVLTGSDDSTARLWDVSTGQTLLIITETVGIEAVTFSPDGTKILLGCMDGTARLYDATTGALIRTFTGHTDEVTSVDFSSDGSQVLTGSLDTTARLWDANTGQLLHTFTGLESTLEAAAFSPDGKYVLAGGSSGVVGLWDAATGTLLRLFQGHQGEILSVAFSPDGERVLTGSYDYTARLWKARVATLTNSLPLQNATVKAMAFSPDGEKLLTGSDDFLVRLWDVATGALIRTFTGHTDEVTSVAFSPDGKQALSGSYDATARLWDIASGQELRAFTGAESGVTSVAFSSDGSLVLTGHEDNTIHLWNAATGDEIRTFSGHTDAVTAVAFSPDGKRVLSASYDGTARLWDTATGQVVRILTGHADAITSVAFSPDGSRVLTGSLDKTVCMWDATTGQLLHIFAHLDGVSSVAFFPSGRLILVAAGPTAYLWDAVNGDLLLAVSHENNLAAMAASSTGADMATASDDTARLWEFDWQPWAERQATSLTLGTSVEGEVAFADWQDYSVVLGASSGQPLLVRVTPLTATQSLAVYGRRGQLPTLSTYDFRAGEPTAQGTYDLLIYPTQNITYYFGIFGWDVTTQGSFRILAQTLDHYLSDVSPRSAGNAGEITLNLQGLGFVDGMQVELRGPSTLAATTVTRLSSTTLVARFDLRGAAIGTYDLYTIWPGGDEESLAAVFTVRPGIGPRLEASLNVPDFYRANTISSLGINYTNAGDADMLAPLFIVSTSPTIPLKAPCHTSWHNGPVYLLGVNPVAPAGTLAPGAQGYLPLSFYGDTDATFFLESMEATETPVDWTVYKDAMRPTQVSEEEWNTIWPTLTLRLGNTWADYLHVLGENAERLRQRRKPNYCVNDLLYMEVQRARGEPTAGIVGQLLNAETKTPLRGVPIIAYQITTTQSITPTIRTEVTDLLDGHFVLDGLPAGRYELLVEGYYFTPTVTVEITNDLDVTGLTLLAHPVEEGEMPPKEPLEVADHKPALVADDSGNVHMVWQRGEEIWHSIYSGGTWTHTLPISGAIGVEPDIAFGPTLIGGSSPGLVVVWQESYSNTARLRYSVGRPDASGLYSWTLPITMTNDSYGDIAPVVVITGTRTPLVLWLQRDWSIEDDLDLYYQEVTTIPMAALVWVRGESPSSLATVPSVVLSPMDEGCVSIQLKEGTSLPSWVPVIGGRYGFEVSGNGCVSPGCEPSFSTGLELGIEFSDRVSGSGSFDVTASWETDKKSCCYVFSSAEASLGAGVIAQIPLYTAPIKNKNVILEVGGTVSGQVDGSLGWKGANFPAWPSSGRVDIDVSVGPYGIAKFSDNVEVTVAGDGIIKLRYIPPAQIKFVTWCIELSAEAKVWILTFSLTKEVGPCEEDAAMVSVHELARLAPQGAMVMYSDQETDGVSDRELLVVTVEPLTGTGHIYGGNPVLSATIGSDLTHDGKAAVARSGSGEILAAWTKDSPDPNAATGSSVVVSSYNGDSWSTPLEIQSADYFNRHTALAFDSNDTPMLLWASAPATVTLSSPVTDVLEAIDNADIYFSRRVAGTWTSPTAVATLPGKDENVRVAADDSGNVVAAWINTVEDMTDTLYTAFWNGSAWSSPITIPVTGTVESLDIAYAGSTPLLVWAQDTDNDPTTKNDLTLFHSTWDGSGWSQSGRMPKLTSSTQDAQLSAAGEVGVQWLPPFSPPQDCCDEDDDDDKPKPPNPPEPPKQDEDEKSSQVVRPVDPNEKVGPLGVGEQRLVNATAPLQYTIYFENVATATAPAQQVVVVDYLSPYLDWSSFSFDEIAFGDQVIPITDEGYQFHTRRAIDDYRPNENREWWVDVSGEINPFTGRVQWTFRTLDPATGEAPTDPMAGFLPPNDETRRGEGHVRFSVRPKDSVLPGTRISNIASIVFDNYETIETNEVYNVIACQVWLPVVLKH